MKNSKIIQAFNKWNKNPTMPFKNKLEKETFKGIYPNGFPMHPLTCGNDSTHKNLVAFNDEKIIKLKCKDCDYVQDFVPSWFFNNITHENFINESK